MSGSFPQVDPIISAMRDPNSYKAIVDESHFVLNNTILLAEYPYYFDRVQLYHGSTPLVETESPFPISNQYQVNYSTRMVTLNQDKEGETVSANYTGKGIQYFPASLIWTLLDPTGTNVTQTLADLTAGASNFIDKGSYDVSVTYETYNIVQYQGSSYMCKQTSTGNAPTNDTYWTHISGFDYKGTYSTGTTYQNGETVTDSDKTTIYQSLVDNNLNNSLTDATKWRAMIDVQSVVDTLNTTNTNVNSAESARVTAENSRVSAESARATNETGRQTTETNRVNAESTRVSQESTRQTNETTRESQESTRQSNETARQTAISNLVHKGAYNNATAYSVNNSVSYNGSTYRCIVGSTGNLPTDTTYWTLEAQAGSVTQVSSANSDITVANGTTTPTLTLNSGSGASQIVKRNVNGKIDDVVTVDTKVGDVTTLSTTDKTDTVHAINEVKSVANNHETRISLVESELDDTVNTQTTTLSRGLQAVTTDQQTPLRVTYKGRTLINIPGKDGNCESLTPFSTGGSGTSALSTTQFKNGSNAIKITTSAQGRYLYKDYSYPLDTTKQYVLAAWVYLESWTSGSVDVRIYDNGSLTTARYVATADTSKVGQWQLIYVKIPTSNTISGSGFRVVIGTQNSSTYAVYFDSIRLYELSTADYNAIGTTYTTDAQIDAFIPYVDSVQHLQNVYAKVYGKQLLPPFTQWTLHANAIVTEPYSLTLNATGNYQYSSVDIHVIPNQAYTLAFSGNGYVKIPQYDKDGTDIGVNLLNWAPSGTYTFTASSSAEKMSIWFANTTTAGTYTFTNPMLNIGSTALPFEPQNDDYQYILTKAASNVDGTVYDELYTDANGNLRMTQRWAKGVIL